MADHATQLDRVMKMLANMDPLSGRVLLRNTARSFAKSSPDLLAQLRRITRTPEQVVTQLDGHTVSLLWGRIPIRLRASLLGEFADKTIQDYRLQGTISNQDLSAVNGMETRQAHQFFFNQVDQLAREGQLLVDELPHGVVELPNCSAITTDTQTLLRVAVANPVVGVGESTSLLVLRQKQGVPGCRVTLSCQQGNQRPVVADTPLQFDRHGMALWQTPVLKQPGLYEAVFRSLDAEGAVQQLAHATLLAAPHAENSLTLEQTDLVWQEGAFGQEVHLGGSLLLHGRPLKSDLAIHARLICGCGRVVDEAICDFKAGQGEIKLISGEHRLALHCTLQSLKGSPAFGSFAIPHAVSRQPLAATAIFTELPSTYRTGIREIPVALSATNSQNPLVGILAAAPPGAPLLTWKNHFFAAPSPNLQPHDGFLRLNTLLAKGLLPLYGNASHLHLERVDVTGGFRRVVTPALPKPQPDWQLVFHQWLPDGGIGQVEKKMHFTWMNVEPDLPGTILTGDKVEGTLHYAVSAPHHLVLEQGKTRKEMLIRENGEIPVLLGHGQEMTIKLFRKREDEQPVWSHAWRGQEPALHTTRFIPLRQGEVVEADTCYLFPNLTDWLARVAKELQNYPFGCAEQTSAKLMALLYLFRHLRDRRQNTGGLFDWIDRELAHLVTMQAPDGHLTLWTPIQDPPEYPVLPGLDALVYHRLLPLLDGPWPQGVTLMNALRPHAITSQVAEKDHAPSIMEQRLSKALSATPGSEEEQSFLQAIKDCLLAEDGRLVGYGRLEDNPFSNNITLAVLALEFLVQRPRETLNHMLRPARQEVIHKQDWLSRLWRLLGLNDGKEVRRKPPLYGQTSDPVFSLLAGIMHQGGPEGHWGTADTVRIIKTMHSLASQRSFAGRFRVDGREITPEETLELHHQPVEVLSDEAIVATHNTFSPVQHLRSINNKRFPEMKADLRLVDAPNKLALGQCYRLEVGVSSPAFPHPCVTLYQSGLLGFTPDIRGGQTFNNGGLELELSHPKYMVVRAIRRGKGNLLGWVRDMYDTSAQYRLSLNVEVV